MEVIYPINANNVKQKNELETLLIPFSIMAEIMIVWTKCFDHCN